MPHLDVIEGPEPGLKVTIDQEVTIGRSPDNHFCLPDGRASRRHARVVITQGQVHLEDMGSANGTFLNGGRLDAGNPYELKEGDEIAIGSSRLIFHDDKQRSRRGPDAEDSRLSLVVTADEKVGPAVNATLDASLSMADMLAGDKDTEKGLQEAVKRLQAMVKVSADLGTVVDQNALLQRIMDSIFDIFPQADRAFILLRDKAKGEMVPAVGRHRQVLPGQKNEFPVSTTIIRTVTENKQSVLSADALQDFGTQRSIVDLSIRSMMCAPFIVQGEILGVINVDIVSSTRQFTSDDLAMLTGIAAQAAIALKNAELYLAVEEETRKRSQLSRYLSPDVVDGVLAGSIPLELGGDKKRGTVFFCDIVGFTSMSEKLTALEVIDKLNRYFAITTEIVTRHQGTVHKFGGDMIMAFWNVMLPDENAEVNAIKTSLEMQVAVWGFDLDLKAEGQDPIYLGIGCNTGEFAGGNIGYEERMEYTIIGDNVNLGQRIESMAGRWQVLVSTPTYLAAKDVCIGVKLPPVQVKGKSEPITIYSIRGIQTAPGTVILDIPARVLTPDCKMLGDGMLTRCAWSDDEATIQLSTTAVLRDQDEICVEFDTPEIKRTFMICGKAQEVDRSVHEGQTEYTRTILTGVSGQADVLDFLKPGAVIESRKTWDEMSRH